MKKNLVTKKRANWIAQRQSQDVIIKGNRLAYNASVQAYYKKALSILVKKMTHDVNRQVLKLFESPTAEQFFIAEDANIASQARILTNLLNKKFEKLFKDKAGSLAERMIRKSDKVSKSNLSASLKKLSGGLQIKTDFITGDLKTIIKASISENVALITSIGEEYLSRVQKQVLRSITTGDGLKSLVPALQKYKGISERKAKNIAIDQTRKVYNSFNISRMEGVGVQEYEWLHSGGGAKPRPSHIALNGKIINVNKPPRINKENKNEPPEYGHPGQAVNCGCTMRPIVRFKKA